jgi:hypothetical protein
MNAAVLLRKRASNNSPVFVRLTELVRVADKTAVDIGGHIF